MRVESFPECCGLSIIVDLPFSYHDDLEEVQDEYGNEYTKQTIKSVETFLIDKIAQQKHSVAALQLVLNSVQHSLLGTTVRQAGFKLLSSNYKNPNTGRRLYIYQYLYRPFFKKKASQ
jgi:hypothetical protein